MMKQKEVEKKFQEFFSFNTAEKFTQNQNNMIVYPKAKNTLEQKFNPQVVQESKMQNFINTHKENTPTKTKIIESNFELISSFNLYLFFLYALH